MGMNGIYFIQQIKILRIFSEKELSGTTYKKDKINLDKWKKFNMNGYTFQGKPQNVLKIQRKIYITRNTLQSLNKVHEQLLFYEQLKESVNTKI